MNEIKVYIAHALSEAPPEFRTRMFALRNSINAMSYARVLPFAWDPVKGPAPADYNVYVHDVAHIETANLMVIICEYPSTGMGGEFERRVLLKTPLLVFTPKGKRVSRFVSDGIKKVRKDFNDQHDPIGMLEWPDPFEYDTDSGILEVVGRWIENHLNAYHHLLAVGCT
jgi:hypothetical protein